MINDQEMIQCILYIYIYMIHVHIYIYTSICDAQCFCFYLRPPVGPKVATNSRTMCRFDSTCTKSEMGIGGFSVKPRVRHRIGLQTNIIYIYTVVCRYKKAIYSIAVYLQMDVAPNWP